MIHVIVISSVRPEPTSAGQIILHRHLVNQPGITLEVYGAESGRLSFSSAIRRLVGRLGLTRWKRFAEDFWVLWQGRWLDPLLPKHIEDPENTVVFTVAHGDGYEAARRLADKHCLPLISCFHDWWPDIPAVHGVLRSRLGRSLQKLYNASDTAICVSEGMREALGPHPNAVVIPPIPAHRIAGASNSDPVGSSHPFRVLYSGNLNDYGAMLGEALQASLDEPGLLLQVRGANPAWREERKVEMRANGRWLDFAPRDELDAWLASADAFLIPMVFDPALRRRMETSFPSKLIEFAQFGKPLVIWGPEYCSAIRWARRNGRALCVTDSSPKVLREALQRLSASPSLNQNLSSQSRLAALEEFDPVGIQDQLLVVLKRACHSRSAMISRRDQR